MEKKKVVVGMSGGVDSSVAAWLLKEQGYDVIGVTMQIWQDEEEAAMEEHGGCCGLSAVDDARRVAAALDIPYYVMNFKKEFKENVIDYFIDDYLHGRTPNPCIACNRYVKWESLLKRSLDIGAEYIATGHYARVEKLSNGRYAIRNSAHKPDSQDICFVSDGDYASYIEENSDAKITPGNFVLSDGTVVGKHKGIIHYTVGQRKGLGLSLGHPVFVLEIRPETNEVVVGSNEESMSRYVRADQVNFMTVEDLTEPKRVWAKIRYNHRGAWCTVEKTGEDEILCTFEEPQRAITPGQAVVLYDGEYVLGGGTIIADK